MNKRRTVNSPINCHKKKYIVSVLKSIYSLDTVDRPTENNSCFSHGYLITFKTFPVIYCIKPSLL